MIRTGTTELLGIRHPIIQGPLGGPWPPSVGLAAAVSEVGALGSLPTAVRSAEQVPEDAAALRASTDKPFAINHTMRPFVEEVFQAILEAVGLVVSFALGQSAELVARAHDVGALFVQQVHTVDQAKQAAENGADVIIAQGYEAGGFRRRAGTLVLVPQVVDAVAPVPVVAAGGIADGRGLAAALALGASGVNVGTRFLALTECEIAEDWEQSILRARSEDTTRARFVTKLVPGTGAGGFDVTPRLLRTPFVHEWLDAMIDAERERDRLAGELMQAAQEGRAHELMPVTAEAAGMIDEILPASEIVRRMVAVAQDAVAGVAAQSRE